MKEASLEFEYRGQPRKVTTLLQRPRGSRALYVLAHGAGAGMRHEFMAAMADRLGDRKIATFRYQFPYIEAGRRSPDAPGLVEATVEAAVAAATRGTRGLPVFAGGKSMGGRLTSTAAARGLIPKVKGLVFLGFPLHAPNKPGDARAAHLPDVPVPMLFLQGTRDKLADLELLAPVCRRLGRSATLHVVDGGDHSFKVLKRSGRTDAEALDELADVAARWMIERA